jgi:ATP-dependent RNA helicase RhlE
MSATSFAELGLRPELLKAVEEAGYTTPTPIQIQAIPVVLAGKDVMGGAQTGTGKTAGFALPILQKLAPLANSSPSPARHPVRALILTPTRELAVQVEESFRTYGKYTKLRSTVVYGGVDIKLQLPIVRGGVEILVATPGRLLDHIEQKSVYLGQVEIFVLDEADRMLDMGFIPDIKRIMALLPVTAKRQNLLFSATFSGEIKKLADQLLNAPQLIEVAKRNTAAETVEQSAYKVPAEAKRLLLEHLVRTGNLNQVLCFMRTKHGATRLARQLEKDGLITDAIHGDKSQAARMEALDAFKEGKLQVLVATDVAARGLDIDDLPLVVNFELPYVPGRLHPPHWPHRARGRVGQGDLLRRAGRGALSGRHRATAEEDRRDPHGGRLRSGLRPQRSWSPHDASCRAGALARPSQSERPPRAPRAHASEHAPRQPRGESSEHRSPRVSPGPRVRRAKIRASSGSARTSATPISLSPRRERRPPDPSRRLHPRQARPRAAASVTADRCPRCCASGHPSLKRSDGNSSPAVSRSLIAHCRAGFEPETAADLARLAAELRAELAVEAPVGRGYVVGTLDRSTFRSLARAFAHSPPIFARSLFVGAGPPRAARPGAGKARPDRVGPLVG